MEEIAAGAGLSLFPPARSFRPLGQQTSSLGGPPADRDRYFDTKPLKVEVSAVSFPFAV